MSPVAIWGTTALLYLGFRAWYDDWRGPLSETEIAQFVDRFENTVAAEVNDVEDLRRFLEDDDGREFVMLNLVRLHPKPVSHPDTGKRFVQLSFSKSICAASCRRSSAEPVIP
jgi:hypothetical protein